MSKKDRVLLMVLTTMMMNTNALSLPASAQSSEVAGGSGGSSISHNALVSSQQDDEQQDTAEALPEEATLEEEARTKVDAPSFNSDIKQICDHKWSSWKTTKSATVSSTGTRQHTCSACGAVETQTTAKLSLRLCGNDRYDTSIAIAKQLKAENGGKKFSSIIVTCGTKYPDALSASYLAKVKNAPILICGSDANSQKKMFDFIKNNTLSSAKVYIIGGTSAVDNNFEKKLKTYFKGSSQITRLWGEDRFKTNIQILKEASKYDKDTSGVVLVAHGMDYADALSASAVGKPILLVNGDNLTAEQQAYLKSAKLKTANIISTGNAVTSKMGTSISKFVSKVTRISGKDKYETSYLVANKFFSKPATVLMTYGENFPDGLCGGPLAIKYNAPMLLVSKENTKFAAKYAAAPAGKSDNAVSNSVTLGGETIMPNEMIKAVVTDKMIQSTVTSKTTAAVDITSQPTNKKVAPGASASFTVKASGKNVKYQWQSSLNGVSWINVNGKTSAAMSVKADLSMDGMKYRCMVTSACGYSVVSNSATLSVTSLAALKQPKAWTGAPDSLACFSCTPNRDGADLLWQYSKDNGKNWIDTAVKTQNYSIKITSSNNGWLYRCRLSDSSTGEVAFSTSAKLTLSKTFKIFRQPASAGGALDTVLYFTVQAGGEGLKYQWQVSTDGKTGWKNVTNNSSATTVRFTQRVVPSSCGKYYRCIVTNKSGKALTSTAARLIPAHTGFVTYGTKTYYILSGKTLATGRTTVGNNTYYFASTGEMLTGVQTISGSKYYFDPTTGKMKTGLQKYGNNTYFFNTDGKAVSGWKTVNSSKYYFAPQSFAAVTGFRTIDSKTYYFNSNGVKTTGVILDKSSGKYRYIADTAVKNAFVTVNGAKYYIDKNGYALTGLQKIGSDTYYFGKSGVMLTGGYLVNKKRYFFDVDTGKAITGIKERENGKKYYYNGANGVGTGLKKVGGKLYRFNSEGEMCFGRWHDTDNDKWYYFDSTTGEAISGWMIHISDNGKAYKYYYSSSDFAAVTGVRKIGDDYYHFNDSGKIVGGTFEFEGTKCYFDKATGKLQTGWYTSDVGYTYYYDGLNGCIKGNKCVQLNGKYYFFNEYGVLCTGRRLTDDGKVMYFDPDSGELKTGFVSAGGYTYYYDGLNGPKTGLTTVDGNEYYFSALGAALKGLRKVNEENNVYKWFDENAGISATGLQYNASISKTYLLNEKGLTSGFVNYAGVLYRFNEGGANSKGIFSFNADTHSYKVFIDPQTGEQQLGLITFEGTDSNSYTYYYKKNECITEGIDDITARLEALKENDGWAEFEGLKYYIKDGDFAKGVTQIDGKTYYFSELSGAQLDGLRRVDGELRYFAGDDGSMLTGWQTIEGKTFYFDETTGKMLTGLQTIEGKTYCLLQGGGYAVGTVMIGADTYLFAADGTGSKVTADKGTKPSAPDKADSWEEIRGKKYYYDHQGQKVKGIQIIGGNMFLFDTSDGSLRTGVITYGGVTRCYTDNGVLSGLQTVGSDLYFFDNTGAAIKSQLKVINDKTYFFTDNGKAATGFCYVPEYLCTYYFDADHTAHIGWLTKDGKKYYFHSKNEQYPCGVPAHGITYVGDKTYYFDYETGVQKTGLIKVGTNKYMYFDPQTGCAVSGFKTINGANYLFSSDKESFGISLCGRIKNGNDTYFFDENTQKAVKGFVTIDQYKYYFDSNYKMATGFKTINNALYYFDPTWGSMKTGLSRINGKFYYFNDDGKAKSGWYTKEGGDRYYFSPSDHAAYTGIHIIDGKKYFFTSGGVMRTGLIWDGVSKFHYIVTEGKATGFIEAKGNTFYVNSDGSVRTGLQTINGATYYFSESGMMCTGTRSVNNKLYYFDLDTGKAVTGFVERENGYTYYFNGANGIKTGLQKIGTKTYLLSDNGIVQYGRRLVGNKIYYFDLKTGEAVSGWRENTTSTGDVYRSYYSPSTLTAVKGLQKIDGAYYYFSDNGNALSGRQKVNNVVMYFDPNTFKLYTGYVKTNDKVYYSNGLKGLTLDKNAKAPAKANTWGTLNGSKCYYGQNGKLLTGLQIIEKKYYLFDENGKLLTGLIKYKGTTRYYTAIGAVTGLKKINASYYYFSPVDGSMLTGLKNISGAMYFFDDTGRSREGWINIDGRKAYITYAKGLYTGLQTIGGKKYWFGTNGIMRTGTITVTEKGTSKICMFGNDGAMVTGLVKHLGSLYYYDTTTGARISGWKKIGSSQYFFDETSGAAVTGKRTINNYNYYFDPETAVRKTGIIKVGTHFYHFNDKTKDGLSYGLTKIDGEFYYFNETSGSSRFGFIVINDVYYYFSNETGRSVGGIQWVSEDRAYLFVKGGGIKKGLVTYEGKQYYLYPSNGKVTIGLVSIGDKLYFFDKSGIMQKNKTVTLSGISYSIDDNGYVSVKGDSKIAKMIRTGIEKLGTPYHDETVELDDAIDPTTGYNCSGFVRKVLSDIDIMVPSIAYRQQHVLTHGLQYDIEYVSSYSDIKPGDIVYLVGQNCYTDRSCSYFNHVHHVMICLNNNQMMHSAAFELTELRGVNIGEFNDNETWFTYIVIRLKNL